MHTKSRPLPILAALDVSICLNSLSNHLANPGCGQHRVLEALGEGRTFIARDMGAAMLETPLQAHAVAPLAFQDIRHSVLQLVAAIHVPSTNARRIDN